MLGPNEVDALSPKEDKEADPFPNLTFARFHLWNFVDKCAYRRMLKLGIPSPWHAYRMGRRDQNIDQKLTAVQSGS